jgi:hypothetical protein
VSERDRRRRVASEEVQIRATDPSRLHVHDHPGTPWRRDLPHLHPARNGTNCAHRRNVA